MDDSIPPVVSPGHYGNPNQVGKPPSDAIVLFDGNNFDHWESTKGEPVKWKLIEGAMEVVRGTGTIQTKEKLGYGQYHVEWRTPEGGERDPGRAGEFWILSIKRAGGAGSGLLQKLDLLPWSGGVDLQPLSTFGECLSGTRCMADL
jgi:hypothetical protein